MTPAAIRQMVAVVFFSGCAAASGMVAPYAVAAETETTDTTSNSQESSDCSGFEGKDQYEQLKIEESKIIKCIDKGYDPPISWRPPVGKVVTSRGAGTTLTHAQNAPDKPPNLAGALPTMSNLNWTNALTQPPWKGYPFQDGSNTCPARTESTFGQQTSVGTTQTLTCGGSISLSDVQFSYMPAPNRLAFINRFSMNIYVLSDGVFKFEQAVALPTRLCKLITTGGNPPVKKWQPSYDLRTPITQVIAYNNSLMNFVIRLTPPTPSAQAEPGKPQFPADDPETPEIAKYLGYDVAWFDPFSPNPDAPKERFLVLGATNGVPDPPTDPEGKPDPGGCYDVATHYIREPAGTNWTEFRFNTGTIDSATTTTTGGTATSNANNTTSCEVETLYPNSADCQKKMLIALLDTPQLALKPGDTASFFEIRGTDQFLTKTPTEAQLIAKTGFRIAVSGGTFAFIVPEGGVIALNDGTFLRINSPGTISAGGQSIRLDGGGQIETSSGAVVTTYPEGRTVTPAVTLPYLLRPNKKVSLPANVLLPTQQGGKLRLPVDSAP